jgi:hypothetical protein
MDVFAICLTPLLHFGLPPNGPLPLLRDASETRNLFTGAPNLLETEHFAIWYGTTNFDIEGLPATGDALELAWDSVEAVGLPQGEGSEQYKFNVYIGDTGGPRSQGAQGYYWYDDEGWPMLVLSPKGVGKDSGEGTAVHEYFHAVQDATGSYGYEGQAAWWFEATAMWFEQVAYPDRNTHATFAWAIAFLPELPLTFFKYPLVWDAEVYHQYGAAVFARHLEERHDVDLVARTWDDPRIGDNPLDVLRELLEERGDDLEDVFFDFAARNATWDYEYEGAYEAGIEYYGGYEATWSHRPSGKIRWPVDGLYRPIENLPMSYGANYWQITSAPDELTVRLDGDAGPEWFVAWAWQTGEAHHRVTRRLSGDSTTLTADGMEDADEVWLVVAAAGDVSDDQSSFGYQLVFEGPDAVEDPKSGEPVACGCSSAVVGGWLMLSVIPLVIRRRLDTPFA